MTVLVVEDFVALGQFVAEHLTKHGHTVTLVQTMTAALDVLIQVRYEAIVLDLRLPDSDPEETIHRLPDLCAMCDQLIVMTGTNVSAPRLIEMGARHVIFKDAKLGFFRDLLKALNGHDPIWDEPGGTDDSPPPDSLRGDHRPPEG